MNDVLMKALPHGAVERNRAAALLAVGILLSLPLLTIFPKPAGWLSGVMAIAGLFVLLKQRNMHAMDWQFLAICLILPASHLWNMLIMGWEPGFLERPAHLLWGFLIYFLIGRYGLRRTVFFYAACMAAFAALGISLYETVYLGNERVFGLGQRWNAVPFGNFSLLFGFFCLSGTFINRSAEGKIFFRTLLGVVGFACGLVASVLSGTRGALLALPFLFLLCVAFNVRLSKQFRWLTLALTAFAIILILFGSERLQDRLLLAKKEAVAYIEAPDNPAARDGSVGIRLGMWHWGAKKFLEHPYTGIGIASYKKERDEAVKAGELPVEFKHLANLHNELITSLALEGLPAAMALFAFWILAWRFFFRNLETMDEDQYYFALCGLVTIMGTALFSMTEGLFGTSAGTKAIMLSLAIPAGALRYHCIGKRVASMPASPSLARV